MGCGVTGTDRQICGHGSRCALVCRSVGTFPDVHSFAAPCMVLKSLFLLPGRRSLARSRWDPLQLVLGPSYTHVAWSSCHQDMDSGSSAPNALFERGQLLAGTNSSPLARDNLINSSKFSHVHASPTTSSKPNLAISPVATGHRLSRLPLVSFSCSALGLSLTYSVIPRQGEIRVPP